MKINHHTPKTHVLMTCSLVAQLGGDGTFLRPGSGQGLEDLETDKP